MKRIAATLALTLLVSACGNRTAVRPPEDTAPIVPGIVRVERDGDAVVVRWNRAERSADGRKLDDLAAFIVERRVGTDAEWERIARVDVADQDKIRRRHEFAWRDTAGGPGARYRVRAVDEDDEEGPPTPEASLAE